MFYTCVVTKDLEKICKEITEAYSGSYIHTGPICSVEVTTSTVPCHPCLPARSHS